MASVPGGGHWARGPHDRQLRPRPLWPPVARARAMGRAAHPAAVLDSCRAFGLPAERPLRLHVVAESGAIRLAKRFRGRIRSHRRWRQRRLRRSRTRACHRHPLGRQPQQHHRPSAGRPCNELVGFDSVCLGAPSKGLSVKVLVRSEEEPLWREGVPPSIAP